MSDTMRDAFEAEAVKHDLDLSRFSLSYSDPNTDYAWIFWQAAQSQPSPPVPQTVQEIMRLMGPYISACVDAGVNNVTGRMSLQFDADVAKVEATFQPLHAALTALVEKNHELQFALDGVNAMRRLEWVSADERLPEWVSRDDTPCIINGKKIPPTLYSETVLVALTGGGVRTDKLTTIEGSSGWWNTYGERVKYWMPHPPPPASHGIEPEQGEVK